MSRIEASLTTGDTTAASLAIYDLCVALRIIGDSTLVSIGSARMASAGVVSAGPSVHWHRAGKPRKEGEVEELLLLAVCQMLLVLVQEVRGWSRNLCTQTCMSHRYVLELP